MGRRMLAAALALLLLLAPACSGRPEKNGDLLQVTVSAFPEYDFVRAVGGSLVQISLLLPPGAEPHSYEPSPQDMVKLQSCRVFVYGGGESDVWLDRLLEADSLEGKTVLSLMDCAQLRPEETQEFMSGAEEAEEETEYDEHVWTSPVNAMRIVRAVEEALSGADPAHRADYAANARAYLDRLEDLDAAFRELAAGAKRRLLVFGDRFPFLYFVREYGLDYAAAFPGCSSATDADPSTLMHLIDLVREEEIPVVFRCDLSAGKLADTIAEATGAKVLTLWSGHTVAPEDFKAGITFLDLLEKDLAALKEALN